MTTAELVRSAGTALQGHAVVLDAADRVLRARVADTAGGWRGFAADAAADRVEGLTAGAAAVSEALLSAADVLRACAEELAAADALQRRAGQLARHHEDADLLAAAQRLRAEAAATRELALHRAAAALRERCAPAPRPRSQVRGFARALWGVLEDTAKQGWYADPHLIALHPGAWWSTVRTEATGLLQAAEHPADALSAAAGLDQLRHHEYGEWAGTMLGSAALGPDSGGARAAGIARRLEREALLVAEDGSWAVRHVSTHGGAVRPRRGVRLPDGFPSRIRDLTPDRIQHILVGDGPRSGGHRSGTGKKGKTEFPPHWGDDDIIRRVMQAAMRPARIEPGRQANRLFIARFDGVDVVAVVAPDGKVISGYPRPGGRGVLDNGR